MQLVWDIFVSFAKVGMLGYGGGPSSIPLMKAEVIGRGWMSETDFLDALAVGNALPGPIATKMSAYIGYRLAGVLGGAAGLAGTVMPSALLMVGLALTFLGIKDHPKVAAMLHAVRPAVVGLLLWTAWDLGPSGVRSWDTLLIALATFAVVSFLRVHPAVAILLAALVGLLLY
ncbi:MAG: chromate transporter [Armatimonadota bacterium]|nr:chromate transporter [Armatimonadota bacterium]MDR5697417.1 chromate transporter [Armatimonadota bacterium]